MWRGMFGRPFRSMVVFGFALPWVVALWVHWIAPVLFSGGSSGIDVLALAPDSVKEALFLAFFLGVLSAAFTAPALAYAYLSRAILGRWGEDSPVSAAMIAFGLGGYTLAAVLYFHGALGSMGHLLEVVRAPYIPLFNIGVGAGLGLGAGRLAAMWLGGERNNSNGEEHHD